VAENRDELEQAAMLLLSKDKKEEALEVYLKLLKLSKGDIRVRSKLADLYLSMDRKPEAIRQLRDVSAGQIKEGQFRAASIVLKRLHELNPTDTETLGQLGMAQKAIGFDEEAKEAFRKVIDMLAPKPKMALPYVRELIGLCPGEIAPKVKLAEVLGRCGNADDAFDAWVKLGREARRRGSTLDQAMFLERGIKIRESDAECLEGAAEARIALGAPKEALVHIQKAYAVDPGSTQVLSMLAQCFELMDQKPKAKKVLIQLAKVLEESNEAVERVAVLERAAACDPDDAALGSEVGGAIALAEKVRLRVNEQAWSAVGTEAEAEVVIRARILADYGFPDRAKAVLEASNGVREAVSVRAMLAEVLAQLEDVSGAIAELEAISADDEASADISTRILVLRGDFDSLGGATGLTNPVEIEEEEDEEEVSIDMDDEDEDEDAAIAEETSTGSTNGGQEAEGDRLAAAGDSAGAIAAYQAALDADPTNEGVLMKLGEIFAAEDGGDIEEMPFEALDPISENMLSAAEPSPVSPARPEIAVVDTVYLALRGQVMLGHLEAAKTEAEAREDLLGACILAELHALEGDAKQGRRVLQEAMDEVDEDDSGYAEGLWGLARLAAMLGKARTAKRLLGELDALAPGYRAADIAVLKAGLGAQ
jgi:tetratricopeptide (TPR) repeat protein